MLRVVGPAAVVAGRAKPSSGNPVRVSCRVVIVSNAVVNWKQDGIFIDSNKESNVAAEKDWRQSQKANFLVFKLFPPKLIPILR